LARPVGYRNYVLRWPTRCTIVHWCRHKSFSSNLNKKPSCRSASRPYCLTADYV